MDYGLQLYGVRDFCDIDMDYCFSRLNEFKYKFVEFAGFFDYKAEEVTDMMKKWELDVIGAHISVESIKADFEGIVAYNKAIGNKNIVIPSFDMNTREEVYELVDFINEYQPKFAIEDMELFFHNHDKEFAPNKDGIVPFDVLLNETKVIFEIDTYWAYFAGKDPVELVKSLGDRVKLLHIKDGLADRTPKSLGEGTAPVRECVLMALEMGLPMIVESEGQIPDGVMESKRCYKYLRKLNEELTADE